eukprot:15887320-Heterocapsa_arctica.AAC.1
MSGSASSSAYVRPRGPLPPAGPPPYGQPMFVDTPDRPPSPQGYGAAKRGSSFLPHPRPPPPRPHEPPQPPPIEAPPWCTRHTFSSDTQNCYMCDVVRHYWRLELARGN